MTPISRLTLRNFLIASHDALATAFALLASFYLRFEGGEGFFVRLPRLLQCCPISSFSASWFATLQPDHDQVAVHLAAGRPEHPAGRLGADP